MINLCNDVLNKERRNLFPKIQTLEPKLSLYSLIFLKKQNPFKFYKSFYDKILKKSNKDFNRSKKIIKNNSELSLLSKTQNYFYSVPIKYNYNPKNFIIKHKDSHNNKNSDNKISIKKDNSLINKSNSNAHDILHNTNLIKIHEYLVRNNDSIDYLSRIKKNKSCKDIYMDNRDDESESESENSIINDKVSRGQQTISNWRENENEKNGEMAKNDDYNDYKGEKKYKKVKIKYIVKKKEKKKKFTIDFQKNRSKIYYKKKNNSCKNKISIIWRNLRRPIIMNFSSSLKRY